MIDKNLDFNKSFLDFSLNFRIFDRRYFPSVQLLNFVKVTSRSAGGWLLFLFIFQRRSIRRPSESLRSFIGKLSKGKFMFIVCLIFLPRHHSGRKHDEKLTVGVDTAEGKVSDLSLEWKYFLPIFKNDEMAFITSPASKLAQTSEIK